MQRLKAFLLRRGPLGGDGVLSILAIAVVELELNLSHHLQGPRWVNIGSGLVIGGGFAWRRSHPLIVAPAICVWVGIQEILNGDLTENSMSPILLLPLVMYSLGSIPPRRQSRIAISVSLLGGYASAVNSADNVASTFLFVTLLLAGPWAVGRTIQTHRQLASALADRNARLEHEKDQEAQLAVAEERARIARELHDVVAHNVSVMVVQAAAARRTFERDPAKARVALHSVESTGREALTEMRRMLGMLRRGDEDLALSPQPSIGQLDTLVQRAREAGLQVDVHVEGAARRLQSSVDLSAFRIVQEALTNTIKHAGPASARVTVRYGQHDVEVDVIDDGRGVVARNGGALAASSGGHGLVGMRERVAMLGGELDAGYRRDGGFGVHARLPLTPSES